MRKIIHIDMDAFFASVEQRDFPEYRGRPLVVGHEGKRGVIAAASYEARRYGVRSAMPSTMAQRKCPQLIFAEPRFEAYKAVSQQVMAIFREYTDLVEPLSLDEAFLDVTDNFFDLPATKIAQQIKQKIRERTSLTASAGISYNKFLAKIASDYRKPDGIFLIRPEHGERFVETLPIESFFGVGKVTAKTMHFLGIKNGYDLKQKSEQLLIQHFGKQGKVFYLNARGEDNRPVVSEYVRKSLGAEITFSDDLDSLDTLLPMLDEVAQEVEHRISRRRFDQAKTLTLKIKYADFRNLTRSKTLETPVTTFEQLFETSRELLSQIDITPKVRLIGIYVKDNEVDRLLRRQYARQLEINFDNEYLDTAASSQNLSV